MPDHDEIRIDEGARTRHIRAGATIPRSADDLDACDIAGPFRGHRCTEPEGHVGDHQHHADGARAVWPQEG